MSSKTLAVVALTAVLAAGACGNPFGSSSEGPRFSPSIRDLHLSRASVFCDRPFTLTFDYRDPQGDYAGIRLLLVGDQGGLVDETIEWADARVNTEAVQGSVVVTYEVDCDLDLPAGSYAVSVTLLDEKGHTSNELQGELTIL